MKDKGTKVTHHDFQTGHVLEAEKEDRQTNHVLKLFKLWSWLLFLAWMLKWGEPDLLDAVINFINNSKY